jgi:hypothetical protein
VEEVFLKADLDLIGLVLEDKQRNGIIGRKGAQFDQTVDRCEPTPARNDAIMTFSAGDGHADQMQNAPLGNIGSEPSIGFGIAALANIGGRLFKVRDRNENGSWDMI